MRIETLYPTKDENGKIVYVSSSGNTFRGLGEITADSEPDYDNWGPDSYWSCSEWVEWHKALVKKYGLSEANSKFKLAWDKQDPFEHGISACRYDSGVVAYFRSQGVDIRSFVSAILLPLFETTANVADTTIDASKGIDSTIKVLRGLLPLAVVGIVGGLGYYGYRLATGKSSLQVGPVKIGKK